MSLAKACPALSTNESCDEPEVSSNALRMRIATRRLAPALRRVMVNPYPAPRYDDVFFASLEEIDAAEGA